MTDETIVQDETEFENTWEESLSEEQAKENAQGNLAPKGKFQGQVVEFKAIKYPDETKDGNPHRFAGKKGANIRIVLYTEEGEKNIFVEAIPSNGKLTAKNGGSYVPQEYQIAGYFYNATKMFGKPFHEVLAYAQENRLVYEVGVKKATDEYPAKNILRGITTVKEA